MSRKSDPTPPAGVLERGITILACFSEQALRLSLSELAEQTGLDKATLLRLLNVLIKSRMMYRFDNGQYALGPALLHMGMLYRRTFDLGERIQPILRQVVQETGETAALYIRSGNHRICLYRENTWQEVRHHLEVGTRLPLSAGGSSSHVLRTFTQGDSPLADSILSQGYAITRAERVPEMASVALPVFDADNQFIGAMVVLGLASRQDEAALSRAIEVVRRELAHQGFSSSPPPGWKVPIASNNAEDTSHS